MMICILIPDKISIQKVNVKDLPADWNTFPYASTTQSIGDRFFSENKFCVLQIPSAVTQGGYNLLINPRHREFKKIKIISVVEFPFDKRIFK